MLVEVQALVDESHSSNPRRVAVGLEGNRLSLLLAVLHRHGGILLSAHDVFVNVVGGVRVGETAADLPALLAAVSSLDDRPVPQDLVSFGEVGLAGEIRPVPFGEERLREAQRLEVVAQLAGGIAHEFNNLLTVIRGGTEYLLRELPPASPLADEVAAVDRASGRAAQLTRLLLTIGRRQFLAVEPLELGAFVRALHPVLEAGAPPGVAVRLALAEAPATAALDRGELGEALQVLVEHAQRRMAGGGTVTIRTDHALRAPPAGGAAAPWTVLEVQDTGTVISEAMRQRLFEPYSSTARVGGWRGLGLAMVQGMVHQARGFIECDSVPDQGTVIRLCFPAVA